MQDFADAGDELARVGAGEAGLAAPAGAPGAIRVGKGVKNLDAQKNEFLNVEKQIENKR